MSKKFYIIALSLVLAICAFVSSAFVKANVNATAVASQSVGKNYPTIVIDAGHGGEDGGAVSDSGLLEKDVNLSISLTLESLLLQSGMKVKMIRSADVSIHDDSASTVRERKVTDIHNRVNLANSSENNILVSVHQNHFTDSKYFGTQVFYSANNQKSAALAESVRGAVVGLLQPNNTRACKKAENVYITDNATVPAVIIECGFLSNKDEAYLLSQTEYRNNMAFCIYLGIMEYVNMNY